MTTMTATTIEDKSNQKISNHTQNSEKSLAIEVEALSKNYGQILAVQNISFQVPRGQLVGFLGPNGAGKSTTMRILTTYQAASSGIARVCGLDVMTQSMEVRQKIGYLPESMPIYPEMRVREYLNYRAKLKRLSRIGRQATIDRCLEVCRIAQVQRRLIGSLSKGYRQRVGLADAILANPEVLILDEPTSGLDPIQIRETLNTIKSLAGDHTVLLSTHILSEVESICDRVIIIDRGKICWNGMLSHLAEQEPILNLGVRGPVEAIQSCLKQQEGVKGVKLLQSNGDAHSFQLDITANLANREKIAQQIVNNSWGLFQIDLRQQKLDDLYTSVVLRRD